MLIGTRSGRRSFWRETIGRGFVIAALPGLVALGGEPRQQAAGPHGTAEERAAMAERLKAEVNTWKERMGSGYIVESAEPCFVIVSNQPRADYETSRDHTLLGFCRRFWTTYGCKKRPDEVLRVFLFNDADSYKKKAKELFGSEPGTPFGYYSGENRALVMNIATGGGTLCHEIVHALAKPDFPDIPSWFNEGLGSLYEQCRFAGESGIAGMVNWRLPGLQSALAAGKAPALKKLVHSTTREFYGADSGVNYAEARYFCMYLQEKGVLTEFYAKFREGCKDDPSGEKFVLEVLKEKDIETVEKAYFEWAGKLRRQ